MAELGAAEAAFFGGFAYVFRVINVYFDFLDRWVIFRFNFLRVLFLAVETIVNTYLLLLWARSSTFVIVYVNFYAEAARYSLFGRLLVGNLMDVF